MFGNRQIAAIEEIRVFLLNVYLLTVPRIIDRFGRFILIESVDQILYISALPIS